MQAKVPDNSNRKIIHLDKLLHQARNPTSLCWSTLMHMAMTMRNMLIRMIPMIPVILMILMIPMMPMIVNKPLLAMHHQAFC